MKTTEKFFIADEVETTNNYSGIKVDPGESQDQNNGLKNYKKRLMPLLGMMCFAFLLMGCNDGFLDASIENQHVPFRPVNPTNTPLFVPYSPRVGVFPNADVISDPNNRFADITSISAERWNFFNNLGDTGTDLIHRFYVWATVNAKGPFGESQFYTAFALHNVLTAGLVAPGHEDTVRNIVVRCFVAVIDEFPEGYIFTDYNQTPEGVPFPADGVIDEVRLASAEAYVNLRDNYSNIFDISVFRADFGSIQSGDQLPPLITVSSNSITKVTRVKAEFGWRNKL